MSNINSKTCIECGITKLANQFSVGVVKGKNGSAKSWACLSSYCKPCATKRAVQRRRDFKAKAIEYLGGACAHCGIRDSCPDIYDFHHVDQTQKEFSFGKTNRNFDSMKVELDKCILLCANCHRRHHALEQP